MADFKYDPPSYWTEHGPSIVRQRGTSQEHRAVEAYLEQLLPTLYDVRSVLDVGCGGGRLASLLLDVLPDARYTGVDIGESQVEQTQKVRPDGTVYHSALQDFTPGRKFDLIIASEVLMHIPPREIWLACTRLRQMHAEAGYIINVDWSQPLGDNTPIASWNWIHDYRKLLHPLQLVSEEVIYLQSVYLFQDEGF